jgi:EmrB/QacA subfamily drug resistance transporter
MSQSPVRVDAEASTSRNLYVVVGSTMLAMVLATLDNLVLGTAMPTIVSELGGVDHFSWVVTSYALATAVSTPVWGKLGDMYGRKGVFMASIVVFLIGSVLAGMSQTMAQLIAFRAMQGLGGGGLVVGALSIIGTVVSPREQGRYQGLVASVMGVTMIAGPIVGGFITDGLGWRWCFYVNLPIGLLALVMIGWVLKLSQPRSRARIDFGGVALWTVAISAVVLITAWGGTEYSWASGPILGLGALGVVAFVGFVLVERVVSEPVLPPRLFRNGNFSVITGVGLGLGALMFSVMTFLPMFMQEAQGASASDASLLLLPNSLAMMATNITAGRIISKTGRYKVFVVGGAALATASMVLLARMSSDSSLLYCWVAMGIAGVGMACLMQTSILITMQSVEKSDLGVASAISTIARTTGGSVGVSVMGVLFAGQVSDELKERGGSAYEHAVADGTNIVFLVGAVLGLVIFVAAWLIREVPLEGKSP